MGPSFVHSLLVRTRWNEDGNPIFRRLAASPGSDPTASSSCPRVARAAHTLDAERSCGSQPAELPTRRCLRRWKRRFPSPPARLRPIAAPSAPVLTRRLRHAFDHASAGPDCWARRCGLAPDAPGPCQTTLRRIRICRCSDRQTSIGSGPRKTPQGSSKRWSFRSTGVCAGTLPRLWARSAMPAPLVPS